MGYQQLRPTRRQKQGREQFFQGRHLILFLIILLLLGGILAIIIQNSWSILVSVSFGALAALLTGAAWLFPRNSTVFTHHINLDPPNDSVRIVRRQEMIEEIYDQLIDNSTSAIVLRGLNGIGTSTLAQQVCSYAENQRLVGTSPFFDSPLWIQLDADTTISDMVKLFSLPGLSSLTPHGQAGLLLRHLNTPKMRRLIVLDFKNPLNQHTNEALGDRPGFKELFTILNKQGCECRILLTSRPWSSESFNDLPICIKEYYVDGLSIAEGIELLQRYNIEGTYNELFQAITFCGGHCAALTILPRILMGPPSIELASFLEDPDYLGRWMQEITKEFLAHIYRELSPLEKELLFAFSIYRIPVTIEAAKTVMSSKSEEKLVDALRKLIRRNFFLNLAEMDCYQLHQIVANHAQINFNDPSDQKHLQEAHKRAAGYYQGIVKSHVLIGQHRERIELLIEAIYHLQQAGEITKAYDLLQQERLLPYLL